MSQPTKPLPPTHDLPFKETYSFQHRYEEATKMLAKYPDRIPVICERAPGQTKVPNVDKKKYLIPLELTCAQFLMILRKRISLNEKQAIFLFIAKTNTIPSSEATIATIYSQHKDTDLFLTFHYSGEDCFGSTVSNKEPLIEED